MSFREKLEKYLNSECKFYQGHAVPVKRTTHMLHEGYQNVWTTMAERDAIDVRFGVQIQSIDRQLHDDFAPVIISHQVPKSRRKSSGRSATS